MSDFRDRPPHRRRRHSRPARGKFGQLLINVPGTRDHVGWAAIAAVVIVVLWYVLYLASGDGGRLLGYANAGGFWFGVMALLASAVLAARRLVSFALLGIVLALLILWQGMGFAAFGSRASDSAHFRLVSGSLRGLNEDMASAATVLLARNPDLIVVQEAHVAQLLAALDRAGTGWNHAERDSQMIACRCRIVASRTQDNILSADLVLPGGTVRIWDVRAPKAYNDQAVNQGYFTALATQMSGVPAGLAAGDFNATPWNDGYAMIAQVARDAWREGGFGPGFTFPTRARHMGSLMPLIQIDHMFLTGNLRASDMKVVAASNGADHYPIVADIVRQP